MAKTGMSEEVTKLMNQLKVKSGEEVKQSSWAQSSHAHVEPWTGEGKANRGAGKGDHAAKEQPDSCAKVQAAVPTRPILHTSAT